MYFFSLSFSVFTAYTFLALMQNKYVLMAYTYDDRYKYMLMSFGIIIMVFVMFFLISSNNSFIKARKKEISTYSLFGMSNGRIGKLLFIETLIVGIVAIIVGIVIIGGIKKIGKVTERVVPFMAGIYVLAALIILGMNYDLIGRAFGMIFDGAFNADAALGGFVGVLIVGFQRAAFSNEAGVGSAAIAHSAVKTKYPASEGIVALLEPFIDTVVICTMTALVMIVTNLRSGLFNYGNLEGKKVIMNGTGEQLGGVDLTSVAFDSAIPHFSIVLTIAVILFAFSTMLSWSYYGLQAWKYLFGKGLS